MKGQLSVDPVFTSYGIYRSTVYLENPVVAVDHNRLYFVPERKLASSMKKNIPKVSLQQQQSTDMVSSIKSILWDSSKTIINCTYSAQYQTLFLLCDDWKLYIYNKNLDQISKLLNWQSKYTVGFQLIQKLGILIMIGVSQVQILKIQLITNIKKTKFLSSVKFNICKKQLHQQNPKTKLKWNKGYGYDIQNGLLFLWSLQDINFYSLKNLQLKSEIRNVVKKEQPITYVYFNSSYKYTVTGLLNGNVRVWRLPLVMSGNLVSTRGKDSLSQKNTSNNNSKTLNSSLPSQYIMIHNCLYHTKQVQKIVAGNDDRVILSQSADLSVCLWSLQTFELLRVYDFQGQYQKIFLYDYYHALAIKDNFLGELKFGKTMEFIMQLGNKIVNHDKTYSNILQLQSNAFIPNPILQTQLTLASNLALQFQNKKFHQKDLNKIDVQHFYPPLKSQQIKQVLSCPYQQNTYYLLTQIGKINRVRMNGLSSIIEYYYSINLTHDIENHPLNQLPTLIKFLYIVPAEFDSEIIESGIINVGNSGKEQVDFGGDKVSSSADHNNANSLNQQPSKSPTKKLSPQSTFQQLKLLTVGCNKGSIVFLPIHNMDHIYTRITYHRQQITSIQTIYQPQIKNSILISMCKQNFMKFVNFDLQGKKAYCFRSIYVGKDNLSFVRGFQDKLAVVLFGGLFEVMQFGKLGEKENKNLFIESGKKNSKQYLKIKTEDRNNIKPCQPQPINPQTHFHQLSLFSYTNYQTYNHESDILSLDPYLQKQLILTGSKDNKIKIWTYNKIQLYQIHLDQGLKYALFSNNYQILINHGQKLLYLRDIPFQVMREEVEKINEEFLSKEEKGVMVIEKFLEKEVQYGIKNSNKNNKNENFDNNKNSTSIVLKNRDSSTVKQQKSAKYKQSSHQMLNELQTPTKRHSIITLSEKNVSHHHSLNQQKNIKSNSGRKDDFANNIFKQGQYSILSKDKQLSFKLSRIQEQDSEKKRRGLLNRNKHSNANSYSKKKNSRGQNQTSKKRAYSTSRSSRQEEYAINSLSVIQNNIINSSITHKQHGSHRSMSYNHNHTHNNSLTSPPSQSAIMPASDILLMKKHLQQMQHLKKQINNPILPHIKPLIKKDDSSLLFDQFMRQKLMNKKVLTRRDITLNRIIMKNIVKENIGENTGNILGLRLEF